MLGATFTAYVTTAAAGVPLTASPSTILTGRLKSVEQYSTVAGEIHAAAVPKHDSWHVSRIVVTKVVGTPRVTR